MRPSGPSIITGPKHVIALAAAARGAWRGQAANIPGTTNLRFLIIPAQAMILKSYTCDDTKKPS